MKLFFFLLPEQKRGVMEPTAAPEINKTKQKKKEKKDTDMSTADTRTAQTKVERNWDIESDDKQKIYQNHDVPYKNTGNSLPRCN